MASGLGGLSDGSAILLGGFQPERNWRERIQPERFGMEGLRGIGQGSVEPGSGRKMRRYLKTGNLGRVVCRRERNGREKMLTGYFKKTGAKRLAVMVVGNIFLGMGISIFKFSGLGNDPFSGMVMALSECVKIEYAVFLILLNVFIFLLEFLFGREFIGAGTLVNAFLLGYIVTFFYNIWLGFVPEPEAFAVRVLIVVLGMVITGFGISLYQTPNVGTAPYDSLSLIMAKRAPKIPYF